MPRAVVAEERLRHERRRLAVLAGDVLDDVLEPHELVGHREQPIELHADLALTAGGDLVVADLDLDAADAWSASIISVRRFASVSVGGTGK